MSPSSLVLVVVVVAGGVSHYYRRRGNHFRIGGWIPGGHGPLLDRAVIELGRGRSSARARTTTAGSVTTGAEVTTAGGGVVSTSRVVVVSTVRSLEQLDIHPSERPTQAARAMLVRIFICGPPVLIKSKGYARAAGKNRISRVMLAALTHPPSCVRSTEQSLCPELRFERSGKTATFQSRSISWPEKISRESSVEPAHPGTILTHLKFCISY